MEKEFKVLEIYDTEMQLTNQKVVILELGEVENIELSTGRIISTCGEAKKYIIDFESPLFQSTLMKAQNNENVKIDTSEFRFREEIKNGIQEEMAYHKDVYLKGIDSKEHYLRVYRMK